MDIERRRALPALTGIRIFAAYYVVMLHTGSGYFSRHGTPQSIDNFLGKGYLAVSLFFVLSGFILAYTYEGKIRGAPHAVQFWEARFARIYPVYLLALAWMVPFSRDLTLPQRLIVLSMVQTWMPWRPYLAGAWNFPAWSLSVEAFFYLCFPVLLGALSRLTLAKLRYLAGFLLAAIAVGNLAQPFENWPRSSFTLVRLIPLPVIRLPEFAVGMIFGLLFLRMPRWKHGGIISASMALLAIAGLSLLTNRWESLVVAPFALLVLGLAYRQGPLARLLSTRISILLGGASYAVYLLQLPVRISTRLLVAKLAHAPRDLDAFLSPAVLLLFSIVVFLFGRNRRENFCVKCWDFARAGSGPICNPASLLNKRSTNPLAAAYPRTIGAGLIYSLQSCLLQKPAWVASVPLRYNWNFTKVDSPNT
ncbi:MAG: acyltransferase family protein [Acidobacteriaceae bacterium]